MLFTAGIIFLGLAAVCAVVFQPSVWSGPGMMFLEFSALVFWGLWAALLLAVAAAVCFGISLNRLPDLRTYAGVIASVTLSVYLIWTAVPHPSNWLRQPRNRVIGLREFIKASQQRR